MSRRDQAIAQRLKVWPLLDLGLYPIPVHPSTRRPLVAWGEIDRLGYRPGLGERLGYNALVFEWWDRWPAAGAAVLTGLSRLLVLDVDPRHGGHHALARLVADRPLPPTRVVRSRSGGMHLYYRTTRLVRSGAGLLGAGLDVKSARALITCPPTPGYALLERRPIVPAPAWLTARCRPTGRRGGSAPCAIPPDSPAAVAAMERALANIGHAARGERHTTTYREACRVFAVTDSDQVEVVLVDAARRASEPSEWRDRTQAVRDARAFIRGRR
jgi:hypothetical protein